MNKLCREIGRRQIHHKLEGRVGFVHEVAPRDGLQNEAVVLSVENKLQFLKQLANAKPSSIEVTSFVRADRVPQLADADELCERMRDSAWVETSRAEGMAFAGLVPNMRGYERFAARLVQSFLCEI